MASAGAFPRCRFSELSNLPPGLRPFPRRLDSRHYIWTSLPISTRLVTATTLVVFKRGGRSFEAGLRSCVAALSIQVHVCRVLVNFDNEPRGDCPGGGGGGGGRAGGGALCPPSYVGLDVQRPAGCNCFRAVSVKHL